MWNYVSAIINHPNPSERFNVCVCACWVDVFTGVSLCLCLWETIERLASGSAELCRSCWLLCWSLPVSVTRSVINHKRLAQQTTLSYWSPSTSPDPKGRITVHMMSVLRTTDQRQCLIIAQGHFRLSVPTWRIDSVIKNHGLFVFKTDINMCLGLEYKCCFSTALSCMLSTSHRRTLQSFTDLDVDFYTNVRLRTDCWEVNQNNDDVDKLETTEFSMMFRW